MNLFRTTRGASASAMPAFIQELLKRGWLGEKAGQGFYKRVGPKKEIHALNLATFDYAPAEAGSRFAGVDEALLIDNLGERFRFLVPLPARPAPFSSPCLTT
jgi:3-hydroxyacyl-CoA dehydrogenase